MIDTTQAAPASAACTVRSRSTTGQTTVMQSSSTFQPTEGKHIRDVGAVRHLPHAVHAGARRAGQGRSASCPNRCRTRSGCTATTGQRRAASRATCRSVKEEVPITSVLGEPRDGRRAAHLRRRQLLHAAHAEPVPRRARRRRRCRRNSTRRRNRTIAHLQARGGAASTIGSVDVRTGRLEADRVGGEPRRPQAADGVSVAPRLAARHRARPQRPHGLRVGRARSRTARSRATTTTPTRRGSSRTTPRSRSPTRCRSTRRSWPDPTGALTTGLLTAVRYVKDNRLLPRGFDKSTADKDVAVHGDAAADADFTGGGDRDPLLGRGRRRAGAVPGRGGALVPADRVSLGGQPEAVRRVRAQAVRRLLRFDVVGFGHRPGARQRQTLITTINAEIAEIAESFDRMEDSACSACSALKRR